MEVRFADDKLDRLETDARFTCGYDRDFVRGYRKVLGLIRHAADERDFYGMTSLHYEKLTDRPGQHSMTPTKKSGLRIVLEFEGRAPKKTVVIVKVEDYH